MEHRRQLRPKVEPWAGVQPQHVLNYLSVQADKKGWASGTLRVHRSALSERWQRENIRARQREENPFKHTDVGRVLDGIENVKKDREQARRADKQSAAITFTVVRRVRSFMQNTRALRARFAVVACAVNGLHRISELLGSQAHPSRRLRAEQIKFYRKGSSGFERARPEDGGSAPDHARLQLEVDKTHQRKAPEVTPIGARTAVDALWNWSLERRAGEYFFGDDGDVDRATTTGVMYSLRAAITGARMDLGHVSSRGFRRGGAAALVAAGQSAEVVGNIGRWAHGGRTQQIYLDQDSRFARMLEASRAMDPDSAPAADRSEAAAAAYV